MASAATLMLDGRVMSITTSFTVLKPSECSASLCDESRDALFELRKCTSGNRVMGAKIGAGRRTLLSFQLLRPWRRYKQSVLSQK